jgi:N-acyl-D-amino-acid deacylase
MLNKVSVLLLVAALVAIGLRAQQPLYDIAIINGRIIDGTGNPWFYGSVAIRGGRIVEIGDIDSRRAARIIDAAGKVVTPGFIDVHTHVEGNIFDNPTADNFLHMGVTTIVTGNCGSSYTDIGEFLSRLEAIGISLNVASLIGHGSVRRAVMGEANREPTQEELDKMRQMVDRAMRDGAFGISTGLIYVPGTYAKTEEIVQLAKVAAQHGGIYATHMRDEGNRIEDAISEALEIGRRANLPVQISHFKVSSKKKWGASRITCRLVAEARAGGQQVTVDQYVYTASSTSINTLFPSWALEGGSERALDRLNDPQTRARIKREMIDAMRESGFKNFSYAVVASYRPDPSLEGKDILQITKQARGRSGLEDQAEQIIQIYLAAAKEKTTVGMVYHKMSELDVEHILSQPFTMIASDSGAIRMGRGVPHPRGYGNNARVLASYVRQKKLIGLEDAICKMTSLPASTFKLWDRGLIRPGMAADIVIFDPDKVRDLATFENPHRYAEGFSYVIVNGEPVIWEGKHTGARPGRALRRSPRAQAQE